MMKAAVYLLIATMFLNTSLSAQSDKDVALTINGKPTSKSKLKADFKKAQEGLEDGSKQTIDQFLEGYIFHALVLEEARSLQVDTTKAYQDEFDSYRIQLSNSFLKDTVTEKKLTEEILKKFDEEIYVNQVFIPLDSTLILPSDTVAPYQRALKARAIAIRDGFDKVEPEVKTFSYGVVMDMEQETGELGWIRPFMFSYKLDEILYSLKLNEVTMPIRSDKGYHVLQVVGRRPTQGNPVVEQVLFNFPVIPASKHMEDSVYQVVMKTYDEISLKGNFQEVCNEFTIAYDRGDAGCLLGEVSIGMQIPASIIKAAFDLKENGEVSKPVLSAYGWHILRLKEIKPTAPKAELESSIKSLIASDKVFPELLARQRVKMLKENKGKINKKAYDKLYALTAKYNPKEDAFDDNVTNNSDVLIAIDNKTSYTVDDFLDYIAATVWLFEPAKEPDPLMQTSLSPMVRLSLSSDILDAQFNGFVYAVLSKYEKESLEERNPKYTEILHGLSEDLLFTKLMEQEVWIKSHTDIEGLQAVFNKNRARYSIDGNPFKGVIVFTKNGGLISDIERSYQQEKLTPSELRKKYNKENVTIQIEEGLWDKGDNVLVDAMMANTKGKSYLRNFPFYTVLGKYITKPEEWSDVKFQVEKDYQDQLEHEFTRQLKNKYKVTINNAVIKEIK